MEAVREPHLGTAAREFPSRPGGGVTSFRNTLDQLDLTDEMSHQVDATIYAFAQARTMAIGASTGYPGYNPFTEQVFDGTTPVMPGIDVDQRPMAWVLRTYADGTRWYSLPRGGRISIDTVLIRLQLGDADGRAWLVANDLTERTPNE